MQGDAGRSNPEDLDFDRGPNVLDQRHTLLGSIVAMPRYDGDSAVLRGLVNGTVFGVGRACRERHPDQPPQQPGEINNDGIASDRPAGVPRNSLQLPARKNVDLRLSRQVPIGRDQGGGHRRDQERLQHRPVVAASRTPAIAVNAATGVPVNPLPASGDQLPPNGGYEQRQFQLGFKFIF